MDEGEKGSPALSAASLKEKIYGQAAATCLDPQRNMGDAGEWSSERELAINKQQIKDKNKSPAHFIPPKIGF